MIHILNKNGNVISLPGEKLGRSNIVSANIDTKNHHLIYSKQYPLSHKQTEIMSELSDEMLKENVIRHSKSPWN